MSKRWFAIFLIFLSLYCYRAKASHIVGGEMTYKYLGDSLSGAVHYKLYAVSLSIYEDCLNGEIQAIAQDNPAFFGVFDAAAPHTPVQIDTNIFYTSSVSVPVNFNNACIANIPAVCLLKKTFDKRYGLRENSSGYVVSYQRCCRNSEVINILDPGDNGSTYYCTIPAGTYNNNSAVFKNYPPQIICLNNPLFYDNSATDADGDSLSYGFSPALEGATGANIKPLPAPPPYDTVTYVSPFSPQMPMTGYPAIQIDPVSGQITGTPDRLGRYLVTVYCNEYRDGILINTIHREFQFVVTSCSKVVVADIPEYSTEPNTYIVDCKDYTVNFVNTSKGGFSYYWDFGVNEANDTSVNFQPTFTYPDTGTYEVKLVVNPGSTCPDSITRLVKVYPVFHADFSDSGSQCLGAAINFTDLSTATIKPITLWKWEFGDGDSTFVQSPVHIYLQGGTYNVILVSGNIKNCVDTVVKQVIIDDFRPFAGNDTVIVKGESIQFNATGGVLYEWSPPDYLNKVIGHDPVGYYPDTGSITYFVHVANEYGCVGDDTVKVTVVDHASFVVPTGFTPNNDGKDDIFRPIDVGYRSLKFFRVFNRWGQQVYYSTTLEAGWDGTFNNKQADIGTYYWEMSFTDRYGKDSFLKGDVTLIR